MFYIFKEEKGGQSKGGPSGQKGKLGPDQSGLGSQGKNQEF